MNASPPRPTLFLIAGPNGAGKTTFYETVLKPRIQADFINADVIQRDELKDPAPEASYEAGRVAAERRQASIDAKRSFVTETVFSHPSKQELLETAREAGFRIAVFHLHIGSADLAVERVRSRTAQGGHDVPEQKIRERYVRNQLFIRHAILFADRGAVYDASGLNTGPRQLMTLRTGIPDSVTDILPDWFVALYGDLIGSVDAIDD